MLKETGESDSSANRKGNPFYSVLFRLLERLGKLMLIACPWSPLHQIESKGIEQFSEGGEDLAGFGQRFEKHRHLFQHLSFGTKFLPHSVIRQSQVLRALDAWLSNGKGSPTTVDQSEAISGAVNAWLAHIYPSLDGKLLAEEVKVISETKTNLKSGLGSVIARWRSEAGKGFKDWFGEEVAGNARSLHSVLRQRLQDVGYSGDQAEAKAVEFLQTSHFADCPTVRIGAALWAGLAHRLTKGGGREWSESFGNDVAFLSAYLPYCDAMFVENTCADLLRTNPVKAVVPESSRIFSMKSKDEFLSFLEQIENDAAPAHLCRVREVYGDGWV